MDKPPFFSFFFIAFALFKASFLKRRKEKKEVKSSVRGGILGAIDLLERLSRK